jgi:alcohol dehydrogenase class IV
MFEFATAARIIFGPGTSEELGSLARSFGARALVVHGRDAARVAPLVDRVREAGVFVTTAAVAGEPTTDDARRVTELGLRHAAEVVIGLGGGSAIDLGKAVAALLANGGEPLDYLEVIGGGKKLERPSVPMIAVPTTAGTGSEVTKNAVLESNDHRVKVSLRSEFMLPRVALVDSRLTLSAPRALTASTGLDALTQVLEPFVSKHSNPMTDALCREAIGRAARALPRVYEDPADGEARDDMALVSLFGGLALANAKLGAVHGFAGPIGGMFRAPHGAVCARLLPWVMRANVAALRARAPRNPALARYADAATLVTGDAHASADEGALWVETLCESLDIPALARYGMTVADFDTVVDKARAASSMKGNPIELTGEELRGILEGAL